MQWFKAQYWITEQMADELEEKFRAEHGLPPMSKPSVVHAPLSGTFSVVAASPNLEMSVTIENNRDVGPPVNAEFLVCFLLPKKLREGLLGDLNEEFGTMYAKFGERRANLWYWKNVLCSFGPLIGHCIVSLVQLHRWIAK